MSSDGFTILPSEGLDGAMKEEIPDFTDDTSAPTLGARTDKLRILAQFLESEVPEERFHMGIWAFSTKPLNVCNTAACAFGWATRIWPESLALEEVVCVGGDSTTISVRLLGGREADWGLRGAARFFGLSLTDADALFTDEYGAGETPWDQATRIREYLDGGLAGLEAWDREFTGAED